MRIMHKLKEYLSPFSLVSFILLTVSVFVYLIALVNSSFADLINSTVSVLVRRVLGAVSGVFPFSFFELLLILFIPIAALIIFVGLRVGTDRRRRVRYILALISLISLIASSYVYTLGVAYRTEPLADKLGIENKSDIETDELYATALLVRDKVNEYSPLVEFRDGESIMGYSMDELSSKLANAYDAFLEDYPIFKNYYSRVKPVLLSTVMSDAGITGIYSFFTGEANVNIEYPDCDLPFTAAHELAHARGFGRENEANFLAFLACSYSDDSYIKYSGYLNLYSYLASALSRTDKEKYKELMSGLSERALSDIRASAEVTRAHSGSLLGKINDKANDIYLKTNGTDGTVSYGYVVRLAVAYYNKSPS